MYAWAIEGKQNLERNHVHVTNIYTFTQLLKISEVFLLNNEQALPVVCCKHRRIFMSSCMLCKQKIHLCYITHYTSDTTALATSRIFIFS